ncbi:class I SAM-dependent methyltransferase [Streptomyces sp. SL13]|uniref:Class I SAM-dependent methyltransferase n=1 Tax=Streptantibioticus silvisoli TaxID=2705255 RepID=A0AA90K6N1_9ACTN|nr:class I SAM-dependent methyltransferase [Streptantibioticus silvisoli]MDI5967918.1 class I SAM-dependent methyltransferase [Streptantibioticus silvisoli]
MEHAVFVAGVALHGPAPDPPESVADRRDSRRPKSGEFAADMMTRDDCIACKALYEKYQLYVYQLIAAQLTRLYGRTGGRVADIGTGPGHLAVELARLTEGDVYALDINPAMLELADETVRGTGLEQRISFALGDVHDIPCASQSFDLLASYTCMHHWAEPAKALAECYRILRPGGLMAVIDVRPVSARTAAAFAEIIPEEEYFRIIDKAYKESLDEAVAADLFAQAGIVPESVASLELTDEDIMDYLESGEPLDILEAAVAIDEPTLWMITARKPLQ